MAEGRWLRIDPERYDELHEIGMFYRDLELNIVVSPNDIPDSVRGGYDEEHKKFVIEFKYMVREEYEVDQVSEEVEVRIGQHSGRILGFEIDVDVLKARSIGRLNLAAPATTAKPFRAVEAAIELVVSRSEATRMENYNVTRRVLQDRQEEVFEAFLDA